MFTQNTPLAILFAIVTLAIAGNLHGQITGSFIAEKISSDTGRPSENYLRYGEDLALTLSKLSPEALARVFEEDVEVQIDGTLNEHLGLNDINFNHGSTDLTGPAMEELDRVVEFLNENPSLSIIIEGHAQYDNALSQGISEGRAAAAALYLEARGISGSRIESVGYGADQPLVESDDRSLTTANRRIEIKVQ